MKALQKQSVLPQEALFRLESPRIRTRPFLKWAGGKSRLLSVLRRSVPSGPFSRYFEPFVGGGALFFDLTPDHAVLSDTNPELISCYEVVRNSPEELIQELAQYHVSESEF